MSLGRRSAVPRMRGRLEPLSIPTVTPFAPGNVPNRLSKVRFSLTRNTTCLIGVRVVNALAFTTRGGSGATVGVAEILGWPGGVSEACAVHAAIRASAIAIETDGRRRMPLRHLTKTMFHSRPRAGDADADSLRKLTFRHEPQAQR